MDPVYKCYSNCLFRSHSHTHSLSLTLYQWSKTDKPKSEAAIDPVSLTRQISESVLILYIMAVEPLRSDNPLLHYCKADKILRWIINNTLNGQKHDMQMRING